MVYIIVYTIAANRGRGGIVNKNRKPVFSLKSVLKQVLFDQITYKNVHDENIKTIHDIQ